MPDLPMTATFDITRLAAMSDGDLAMHFVAHCEDDPHGLEARQLLDEAMRRGLSEADLFAIWEASEAEPFHSLYPPA